MRHSFAALVSSLAASLLVLGCTSAPHKDATAPVQTAQVPQYPARPAVAPPPFKVFHHDANTMTLVTRENATDAEIESLIWELRDAAHARTFDTLKVSQKAVDQRDHKIWFHIYRGAKCASEKYASGPPPCGASYHAAGDYTFGSYTNPELDDGILLHDENHEVELWDPDKLYVAPSSGS
jgi:hypothetical protein